MGELSTSPMLADALAAYLSEQAGQKVTVDGLQQISNGWESDVYAFDTPEWHAAFDALPRATPGQTGGQILRLYFGAQAGETALHEFGSMQLLARAGYPVPRVDLVEPSPQPLGRPFMVMQRIEGISLGRRLREVDVSGQAQEIARFCGLLTKLHSIAWQHLPGAERVPTFTIAQQIDYWRSFAVRFSEDVVPPAVLAWLDEASRKVEPLSLGLVHWDFHHENVLIDPTAIDPGGQAWVIDWTQFQATDIRFDLAWTLVVLASERDEGMAQAVRAGYYAQRGWDAAAVEADMNFFEAAACGKRLISVLISLHAGADAVGMRPGAEAIMSSRLSRIALVYQRWLALTDVKLPSVEKLLVGHL